MTKIKTLIRALWSAMENASEVRRLGYLLSDARSLLIRFEDGIVTRDEQIANLRLEAATLRERLAEVEENLNVAVDRLEQVAENETTGANATVRRIARIAREAVTEIAGSK